jgi:hypothetical protein
MAGGFLSNYGNLPRAITEKTQSHVLFVRQQAALAFASLHATLSVNSIKLNQSSPLLLSLVRHLNIFPSASLSSKNDVWGFGSYNPTTGRRLLSKGKDLYG